MRFLSFLSSLILLVGAARLVLRSVRSPRESFRSSLTLASSPYLLLHDLIVRTSRVPDVEKPEGLLV